MPSLLRAYEISARAAAVGFDWARATDVLDKIDEEVLELRHEVESGATGHLSRAEEEMGDLLFAIANLSRKLGIEPEAALRRANDKFTRRFEAVEHAFDARGGSLQGATLQEMEDEWQRVKQDLTMNHEGHEDHATDRSDHRPFGMGVQRGRQSHPVMRSRVKRNLRDLRVLRGRVPPSRLSIERPRISSLHCQPGTIV